MTRLLRAGYHGGRDFGEQGGVVVSKGPQDRRTHILHLVPAASEQWREYLAFRDALRGSAVLREEYAALKRKLAVRYWSDRPSYLDGKSPFIERIVGPDPHE